MTCRRSFLQNGQVIFARVCAGNCDVPSARPPSPAFAKRTFHVGTGCCSFSFPILQPFLQQHCERCLSRHSPTKPAWRALSFPGCFLSEADPTHSLPYRFWDFHRIKDEQSKMMVNCWIVSAALLGSVSMMTGSMFTTEMMPGELLANGSVYIPKIATLLTPDQYQELMLDVLYIVGPLKVTILTLYSIVILVAAVSNLLIIIVIYRFQHLHR